MNLPANDNALRAPFPWFGGKARAASLIWEALGDVGNYVEPFAGSLAVLLGRPSEPRIETVNDRDCYLANFWRSIAAEPVATALYADWPVNEADLTARHTWLVAQESFRERMLTEPEFYDVRVAGWWVWGLSQWIGSGWCDTSRARVSRQVPRLRGDGSGVERERLNRPHEGEVWNARPHLTGEGMGVHRKRPHLANAGKGVQRQMPNVDGYGGKAFHGPSPRSLAEEFEALSARLRRTRVCCGDWKRVLTPTVTRSTSACGVVLDPPYATEAGRAGDLYAHDESGVSAQVRAWALEHGNDPGLRIVLCGYEGEHPMPDTWRCVEWKAVGGYSTADNPNRHRERLWLSPHCQGAKQLALFGAAS